MAECLVAMQGHEKVCKHTAADVGGFFAQRSTLEDIARLVSEGERPGLSSCSTIEAQCRQICRELLAALLAVGLYQHSQLSSSSLQDSSAFAAIVHQ